MTELDAAILEAVQHNSKTYQAIADELGTTYKVVRSRAVKHFPKDFLSARKRANYSRSKLGDLNPMRGKTGEHHHNYVGRASDHKGYYTIVRPTWYTGSKAKRVFEHHVVWCLDNNETEIPKGHEIHHIDVDPSNNDPSNLIALTKKQHYEVHRQLRRFTNVFIRYHRR